MVGFDGSTTIAEFLNDLNTELGCRPVDVSGFTIFSDDPLDKELEHALHLDDKVRTLIQIRIVQDCLFIFGIIV